MTHDRYGWEQSLTDIQPHHRPNPLSAFRRMEAKEGIIMTLVSSGVNTRPVDQHTEVSDPADRRRWWTPRWLQRRRQADDLTRWASEVIWQWNDTLNNTDLAHHTVTAARLPIMVAPQVHSIDPGPPVTLLVRMLPGQVVHDFQTAAHRLAAGMDVPDVRVTPCGHGWINVALLDHPPLSAVMPVAA